MQFITQRQSEKELVEVPNGFKRRNTRRLQGPSGEKIILHSKNGAGTLTRDVGGSKCILDVEQSDQAMFGFVEKVLDTSNIPLTNGSNEVDGSGRGMKSNGKASFQTQIIRNGQQKHSHRENTELQSSFGNPLLTSTFRVDKVRNSFHGFV